MFQNWLKPLGAAQVKNAKSLPTHAFGANILLHSDALPDLKKIKAAIVGVGEKEANAVRTHLYSTSYPFAKQAIADLGNLRKADTALLIPVIAELLNSKIVPVIIAADANLIPAQFLAYQESKSLVNLAIIDELPRFGLPDQALTKLFAPRHPALFHFSMVGYQIHHTPPEVVQFLQKNNFDAVRLGRSRATPEETEPVLRDADLVAFHLGALKQSDAPGVRNASPSGFLLEEACQLCRYAGMSDKLSSFGVYGFCPELDRDQQTAQAVGQMVWYFLEGFFNRKQDYPVSKDGLSEYVVEYRQLNYQLTFWKSQKSGRWWMQVPVATRKKHERHRLVPCSYQDYQAACREELPERLMAALNRFG
jgi:formiminoglutamase